MGGGVGGGKDAPSKTFVGFPGPLRQPDRVEYSRVPFSSDEAVISLKAISAL